MRYIIALGVLLCSIDLSAEEFTGTVVSTYDGDTTRVEKEDGTVEKIRFLLCDTPEIGQAHGIEARDFVRGLIDGKEVTVKWKVRDKYGRVVGEIFLKDDPVSVNRKIIAEGHGWWFYHYSDESDVDLGTLEAKAKALRKGLWKAQAPLYPRSWRRGARLNSETSDSGSNDSGTTNEDSESTIRIMALMPDPTGRDANNETVVLANNSNVEVSIDQWKLVDDDNGIFILSGTIPASGTRTIRLNSSLQLGNSGDIISLIKAGGDKVQTVNYSEVSPGKFVVVP